MLLVFILCCISMLLLVRIMCMVLLVVILKVLLWELYFLVFCVIRLMFGMLFMVVGLKVLLVL